MKGKLEIEVITPLFIGNGEQYSPFEYIFERGFFNPIDIEKLIETKLREGNRAFYSQIFDGLEKGDINLSALCKDFRIDYRKFARYTLSSPRLGNHDQVLKYIKSGGKVFIPGSSIKGALRSVLTKHVVNSRPELDLFTGTIEKVHAGILNNVKFYKDPAKDLDDEADREIFGMTYDSPFRFISISDSDLQDPEILKVCEVKILNICNGKVKWFSRISKNRVSINEDTPEKGRSIFLEGIKEKSSFSCFVSMGKNSPYIVSEARIKNAEIIVKLVSKINEEIKKYIKNEISFFKTYGSPAKTVADFYNGLLEKAESLKEDEFLLQVGFGTGMLSKTILQYLDDDMKSKVADISKHKHYDNTYPKTRRIVFENGQPKYVPGWIKCKLVPG